MKSMTAKELKAEYLKFFKERKHAIIPSASLVPSKDDPTVLFTTTGMHPLVPYIMGKHQGVQHFILKKITPLGINTVEDQPEFKRNFGFEVNLGLLKFSRGASEK